MSKGDDHVFPDPFGGGGTLTKREYFAIHLLASEHIPKWSTENGPDWKSRATEAVQGADALIAALNEETVKEQ
jgi:hypothetical protein